MLYENRHFIMVCSRSTYGPAGFEEVVLRVVQCRKHMLPQQPRVEELADLGCRFGWMRIRI